MLQKLKTDSKYTKNGLLSNISEDYFVSQKITASTYF